jgi:hypothetical protein
MNNETVAQALAKSIVALRNCERLGNTEWAEKHRERIRVLARELPSGGGIDNGTQIEIDRCSEERLVFTTAFHHMNEYGIYEGWTEHSVTVRCSLALGLCVSIGGRDQNGIKDYLGDTFRECLGRNVVT